MNNETKRFLQFKGLLKTATGDTAIYGDSGTVTIAPNEFTVSRTFRSLQAAIDAFSRFLPIEFVNVTH